MTSNLKNKVSKNITNTEEQDLGQLSVDIYELPNEILILAPIAGVKLENINLSITDDILTISGERNLESSLLKDKFIIQECFWGNFSRSIILPDNIENNSINASFKDGVLKISIQKIKGKDKTKLIRIKSNIN